MGCEVVVAGASSRSGRRSSGCSRRGTELQPVPARKRAQPRERSRGVGRHAYQGVFAEMVGLALEAGARAAASSIRPSGPSSKRQGITGTSPSSATGGRAAPSPGRGGPVATRGPVFARVPTGVRLDLNGVVKAQTVDNALALIDRRRVRLGRGRPGRPWRERRRAAARRHGAARSRWRSRPAAGTGGAGATADGSQHHLIDPRTGLPARSPWEPVSVCGSTCLGADVAAKGGLLLGARAARGGSTRSACPAASYPDGGVAPTSPGGEAASESFACT